MRQIRTPLAKNERVVRITISKTYFLYSKTCVKRPLKIDKKVLMEYGSLMKVESIAECSNTFDLH